MELQTTGVLGRFGGTYLIQAKQSTGGVVKHVMIDFVRSKRRVERKFDIGRECCEPQRVRHSKYCR